MVKYVSPKEMIDKITSLQLGFHVAIVDAMDQAAQNIAATAQKYCTPGHSPWDWQVYDTKLEEAILRGIGYSGAPYSLKSAVLHMRDTIQGNVRDEEDMIMGVVWTPAPYAIYVHEGTSLMQPGRPFLLMATEDEMPNTMALLAEALEEALEEEAGK